MAIKKNDMTLQFVKPCFANLCNNHINTKPSLDSKLVDGKECETNKNLPTGGEIVQKFQPPPPPPGD